MSHGAGTRPDTQEPVAASDHRPQATSCRRDPENAAGNGEDTWSCTSTASSSSFCLVVYMRAWETRRDILGVCPGDEDGL